MKAPTLFDTLINEQWIAVINDEIEQEDGIAWLFEPVDVDDSQLAFDLSDDDEEYSIENDYLWIARGC